MNCKMKKLHETVLFSSTLSSIFFLLFLHFGSTSFTSGDVVSKSLTVLVQESVSLPCDIKASTDRGQTVNTVSAGSVERTVKVSSPVIFLWYKGDSPEPFYSYDLRVDGEGRHWSDQSVLGDRAHFSISPYYKLAIDQIVKEDDGIYKCRVDYETGPSRTVSLQLNVVVLPSKPKIIDESGQVVSGVIGPFREGRNVVLTCKSHGGQPSPSLIWVKSGRVVEDTYIRDKENQVSNLLHLNSLSRDSLEASYTCRASNNNITGPLEDSVIINMTLAPLTIQLTKRSKKSDQTTFVRGGVLEVLECSTTGSRPSPKVTWWRDGQHVERNLIKETRLTNLTESSLSFRPVPDDHGVVITCRVENQILPGSVLEESYKLNVHYVPITSLKMGFRMNPQSVREGTDVFLECSIKANPSIYKKLFLHHDRIINHNITGGVILSNQTLVLQQITRQQAGPYSCAATNSEGRGVSQPLTIHILYAPVCKSNQTIEYKVLRNTTSNITCIVDAQPNNVTFSWRYNNTGTLLEVHNSRSTSMNNVGTLHYTPTSQADFGTLLCSARNIIGEQSQPCVINVTDTKPPNILSNCERKNETGAAVVVTCKSEPSEMPTKFYMEVLVPEDSEPVKTVTNTTPYFVADGLPIGTAYILHFFTYNQLGYSEPIELKAVNVKAAENRMGGLQDTSETSTIRPSSGGLYFRSNTVLVGAIMGIVTVLVSIVVTVTFKIVLKKRRNSPEDTDTIDTRGSRSSAGSQYSPPIIKQGLLQQEAKIDSTKYNLEEEEINVSGACAASVSSNPRKIPSHPQHLPDYSHQSQNILAHPSYLPHYQPMHRKHGLGSSRTHLTEDNNPDVIQCSESKEYQLEELRVPLMSRNSNTNCQLENMEKITPQNHWMLTADQRSAIQQHHQRSSTAMSQAMSSSIPSECQYYQQCTLPRQRHGSQQKYQQPCPQQQMRSLTPPPNLQLIAPQMFDKDSSVVHNKTYTPPEGFMEDSSSFVKDDHRSHPNVQVNPNDPLNRSTIPITTNLNVLPPITSSNIPSSALPIGHATSSQGIRDQFIANSCSLTTCKFNQLQTKSPPVSNNSNPSSTSSSCANIYPVHTVSVINPLNPRNSPVTHLQQSSPDASKPVKQHTCPSQFSSSIPSNSKSINCGKVPYRQCGSTSTSRDQSAEVRHNFSEQNISSPCQIGGSSCHQSSTTSESCV